MVIILLTAVSGHFQPLLDENIPDIQILSITTPALDLFEVQLLCKTCTSWTGSAFDVTSPAQHFIWAANSNQRLATDDKNASIEFHEGHAFGESIIQFKRCRLTGLKGTFKIDMVETHIVGAASHMPTLTQRRISGLAIGSRGAAGWSASLMPTHGFLGSLAMLVFPIGVHILQSRSSKDGVWYHWITQAVGTGMMTLTGVTGLWYSVVVQHSFASVHQVLGGLLLITFYGQV